MSPQLNWKLQVSLGVICISREKKPCTKTTQNVTRRCHNIQRDFGFSRSTLFTGRCLWRPMPAPCGFDPGEASVLLFETSALSTLDRAAVGREARAGESGTLAVRKHSARARRRGATVALQRPRSRYVACEAPRGRSSPPVRLQIGSVPAKPECRGYWVLGLATRLLIGGALDCTSRRVGATCGAQRVDAAASPEHDRGAPTSRQSASSAVAALGRTRGRRRGVLARRAQRL